MKLPTPIATFIRLIAGEPEHVCGAPPAKLDLADEPKTKNDYVSIGIFSSVDAPVLLARLDRNGIAYHVECDTSAGRANVHGLYNERATVEILVRSGIVARAQSVMNEWQEEVGAPSDSEIFRSNQSNDPTP
jgi:hypothetical protein